jgi:muramoyltetrapeptide carboxypeptidase
MLKPKALRPGDTLGFVAPSSPPKAPQDVRRSVEAARAMGFRVVVGESCQSVRGYLAGDDEMRARDLNRMFADDSIDGIIAIRGGYGAPRILDRLDYELAAAHPKLLVGYSDITALHIAYAQRSGLVTLHAPMPATEWIVSDFDDFTSAALFRALTGADPPGPVENPPGYPIEALNGGVARGRLAGGNLCLIAALNGTPFELDARGVILILEDIGEYVHRLDRMLTTLRLSGKFDQCAGIVLGGFTDCPPEHEEQSLTIRQVIEDVVVPCGKPILSGYMIGHCSPKVTLALGVQATLDARRGLLTIDEAALTDPGA